MRHEIGVGSIMWGTDYPHPEGSWPYTKDQLLETFSGLPEDEIGERLVQEVLREAGDAP